MRGEAAARRDRGRTDMAAGTTQPTNEELIERLRAVLETGPEAAAILGELWERNIRLVRQTVHKLTGLDYWQPEFEDMEQQAYLGFYEAAISYRPESGTVFSTYAVKRIRWELCRYYERNGSIVRIPAYIKGRIRKATEKRKQLEAETGRPVSYEAALQALGLSPEIVSGTLAIMQRLETESLDADISSNDEDGITLLDRLAAGEDLEADALGQIWQKELHELLMKAMQEIPDGTRAIIHERYFVGKPAQLLARERGITPQTLYDRLNAAFRSIRAGRYGPELAEFAATSSAYERAQRMIKQDREALERLQLTEAERGLLAL